MPSFFFLIIFFFSINLSSKLFFSSASFHCQGMIPRNLSYSTCKSTGISEFNTWPFSVFLLLPFPLLLLLSTLLGNCWHFCFALPKSFDPNTENGIKPSFCITHTSRRICSHLFTFGEWNSSYNKTETKKQKKTNPNRLKTDTWELESSKTKIILIKRNQKIILKWNEGL